MVIPSGIVASSLPAVRGTINKLGQDFDPWQIGAAKVIVSKTAAGTYAADTVVLSIPRQVGKTFLIGLLVFADSIIHPGTTTVWTAHRFKVARETFNELRGLALLPALAPHIDVDDITTAAGNESIPFRNGSRIVFAARERGAIRGFTKVRRLVLDEGQILTEAAMSDLAPTQNQAVNPQLIIMGTPPKPSDPSETFSHLRAEALAGESSGTAYIEFSADADCDVDDEDAWAEANPSLHNRTPIAALRRLRKLLSSDDDFRREALGIWSDYSTESAIDPEQWAALECPDEPTRPDPVRLAVTVSEDRKWAQVGLAGRRQDGRTHLQIIKAGRGTGWVIGYLTETVAKWRPGAVAVMPSSPAGSLIPAMDEAKLPVLKVGAGDAAKACGLFADVISDGSGAHPGQGQVAASIASADKRTTSTDAWMWKPRGGADISPLWALTLANYALAVPAVKRYRTSERRAVVM